MKIMYGNFHINSALKNLLAFIVSCIAISSTGQVIPSEISAVNLDSHFSISSSFSATETWTDNISLSNGSKNSGWIHQISPGVAVQSSSGKVKGYFNYSLTALNYSAEQSKSSLQNSLNSLVNVEVIDGHGFIDVSGLITQQTISAFSTQTSNNNNYNLNKTEVATYRLTPYYRGRLSNILDYEARYSLATTNVKNADNFSSIDSLTSLKINGNQFFGKLAWGLNANHQISYQKINSKTEVDNLNVSLSYPVTDQFTVSVTGGRVIQNYTSSEKQSSWSSGTGLNWSISERTKLSTNIENNPLGKMHSISFEHRTPRTSWIISDVKSVSLSNSKTSVGLGNNYDLLFIQFSSIEPDPIKRAQLVNDYLKLNNISQSPTSVNGYLTYGTSLQRSQNISFAVLGVRDTITFSAVRSVGQKIGNSNVVVDDFNKSSFIKQNGFTVAYIHRLTEDTVINNQFSNQKIFGELESQNSNLKSVNISASTRVGVKTYITLSARHSISSSISSSYKETAVIGNLTLQF